MHNAFMVDNLYRHMLGCAYEQRGRADHVTANQLASSLASRCHPQKKGRGLVNLGQIFGSHSMAHTDKTMQSLYLIGLYLWLRLHLIATGGQI